MKHCDKLCCTQLEHLSVADGDVVILDDVNLHLHCGEITTIIGPNGAGKSTLFKTLIGEQRYRGDISFRSEKGTTTPIIGYVPQRLSFDADSPATVFDLFRSCTKGKKEDIQAMLNQVGAGELLRRRLACLSGGELQRVLVGLALEPRPNLLLLDEPVSGVDHGGIELFWQLVADLRAKYDMTILLISHHLEQVRQYSDRVVLLDTKVLSSGTPEQVFSSDAFHTLFGRVAG